MFFIKLCVFSATDVILDHRVECLQLVAIGCLQRLVANGLKKRLVILVNKDNHALSRFLTSIVDNVHEAFLQIAILILVAIQLLPSFQMAVQLSSERRLVLVFTAVQVEMQNGIGYFIVLLL